MFSITLLLLVAQAAATDIQLTILQRMTDARTSSEKCPAGRWLDEKCVLDENWKASTGEINGVLLCNATRPLCPGVPRRLSL